MISLQCAFGGSILKFDVSGRVFCNLAIYFHVEFEFLVGFFFILDLDRLKTHPTASSHIEAIKSSRKVDI